MNTNRHGTLLGCVAFLFIGLASVPAPAQEPAKSKYKVKITDEKEVVVAMEDSGPIDPQQRINFQAQQGFGNFFVNITTTRNEPLSLSHFPQFMIGGQVVQPGGGLKVGPLPKSPTGKARVGSMTTWDMSANIRITQFLELHPSKATKPGEKRLMNNVLIVYVVENKGKQTHNVAMRVCMDTYVIDNDGCLFAAPTMPGKVLDGVVLKDKTMPQYVNMLQRPDLKNPLFKSYLTLNVGSKYDRPDKIVLSSLRAGFGNWEMQAIPAGGDSAISFYWPAKDIKPGAKREMAYAYGEGIAVGAESEGRFQLALGGSCEPGKIFTISAVVADPGHGQSLSLELPAGVERVEGKEVQPVAALAEGQEYSTVLWKARVKEPGDFAIRVRSSTGITLSKVVSVTAAK